MFICRKQANYMIFNLLLQTKQSEYILNPSKDDKHWEF